MFNNKPVWIKSSRCAQGDCVLVAAANGLVEVRDSKLGDGSPVLSFDPAEWAAFVAGAKSGEFDVDRLTAPAVTP